MPQFLVDFYNIEIEIKKEQEKIGFLDQYKKMIMDYEAIVADWRKENNVGEIIKFFKQL